MGVIDSGLKSTGALSGGARVLYAPTTVAVPSGLHSIIDLVPTAGVYAPKTGWVDFGFSPDAPSYSRDFDTEGWEYEQTSALLFESISEVNRSVTVNIGNIEETNLQIIENSGAPTTVAAAVNQSAQKVVKAGSFTDRPGYRIAIIAQRPLDAVTVTEGTGGPTRGALVAHVVLRARIAADEAEIEHAKGDPSGINVEFTAFPEPGQPIGQEYVHHYFEQAGVISLT